MQGKLSTCLWFNGQAEEAAEFYVSVIPNSRIEGIMRYTENHPFPSPFGVGAALLVRLTLGGHDVALLNGGPEFKQSEAASLVVPVEDQAELDRIWAALVADGGAESQCGWCRDRYGVSWQVMPADLIVMQEKAGPEAITRMWAELVKMKKIDIAALEAALGTKVTG